MDAWCSRRSCCRESGFWRAPSRRSPGWCGRACWRCCEAAPDRVTAPCPVYGRCGGCHYQHAPYEYQLAAKRAILVEALQRLGKMEPPAEIAVVAAEPFGYRNRVQLHVEENRLGYREGALAQVVRGERVPGGVAEDQSGDRGADGDAARRAVAAIHTSRSKCSRTSARCRSTCWRRIVRWRGASSTGAGR